MARWTPYWRELRKQQRALAKGKCEGCGTRLVSGAWHLHHLTYERRGHEHIDDVRAICLDCHHAQHPHITFKPMAEQRAVAAERKHHNRTRKEERRERRLRRIPQARDELWEERNGKALADLKMIREAKKELAKQRYRPPGLKYG